jgi:hypothetical protein
MEEIGEEHEIQLGNQAFYWFNYYLLTCERKWVLIIALIT